MKWKHFKGYGFVRRCGEVESRDVWVGVHDFRGEVSSIMEGMKVKFRRPFPNRHDELRTSRWWSVGVDDRQRDGVSRDGSDEVDSEEQVLVCVGIELCMG